MATEEREGVRKRARGLLGLSADLIQVMQFISSIPGLTFAKAAFAVAVVGGTSYAGYRVIEHQAEVQREEAQVASAVVVPTSVPKDPGVAALERIQLMQEEWKGVFTEFRKRWQEGDPVGILSLTDVESTPEKIQEIGRWHNRVIVTWKFLEDVELLVENATLYSSGDSQSVTIPVTLQGKVATPFELVKQGDRWVVRNPIGWLVGLSPSRRTVSQSITFLENGENRVVPNLTYPMAGSMVFSPYSVSLEFQDGYIWWEGAVYLSGQPLTDSWLGGSSIHLSETAIADINSSKATEIELREIKNGNPYRTMEITEPVVVRLW